MTTISDAELDTAALALAGAVPLAGTQLTVGKIYEAWLMLELGLALKPHGWTVEWRDWKGVKTKDILFRGGPAPIKPASDGGPAPGFILIERQGEKFEIHNSVQFRGGSGALHEIDVSIIEHHTGEYIRRNGSGYPENGAKVALELKCYTTSMPIGVVRAMTLAAIDTSLVGFTISIPSVKGIRCIIHNGKQQVTWVGDIDSGYVGAITSAPKIGRSRTLAKHYGAHVTQSFDSAATSNGAFKKLASDINQIL
jgi:hypothetical protein